MNKLIKVLTLAAAVVAASVQFAGAQVIQTDTILVGPNSTTNIQTAGVHVINCVRQRNVGVKWTINVSTNGGAELCGIRWIPSIDSTCPTVPTLATGYSMAVAANGITGCTVQTNFDSLGYAYLIGGWVTNGTAGTLTNKIEYLVNRTATAK